MNTMEYPPSSRRGVTSAGQVGLRECWNIENPRLVELNLILYEWFKPENINSPSSAFDLNLSITPPLHVFSYEAGSFRGRAYYVPGEGF